MAGYGFLPGKEVMHEIKFAASKAMQLDQSLEEPYHALAQYYLFEWNWSESKRNFINAIELNPKYAQIHSIYGMIYLAFVERNFDEAEKQARIGIKLEPLSAIDHADLSWILYTAHKFEEALQTAQTGIELDANSFLSHRLVGLCYSALHRHDKAIETLEFLSKISNRHQHAINSLIWAYCQGGNTSEANKLMQELRDRSKTEYIAGMYTGISAAWLNNFDLAFEYLEMAINDQDPTLFQIKYSPFIPDTLKKDPRFQNIIQRMAYPL